MCSDPTNKQTNFFRLHIFFCVRGCRRHCVFGPFFRLWINTLHEKHSLFSISADKKVLNEFTLKRTLKTETLSQSNFHELVQFELTVSSKVDNTELRTFLLQCISLKSLYLIFD